MTTDRAATRESGASALVPEMLAGHVLMMRLAAAADGFLGQADGAVPNLTLHATRTTGLVARLMERYRRGMVLLDRLSGADPDGAFVAAVRAHWADCRAPATGDDRDRRAAAAPLAPAASGGGLAACAMATRRAISGPRRAAAPGRAPAAAAASRRWPMAAAGCMAASRPARAPPPGCSARARRGWCMAAAPAPCWRYAPPPHGAPRGWPA